MNLNTLMVVRVRATRGHKTSRRFVAKKLFYRDDKLDRVVPVGRSAQPGEFVVVACDEVATLTELVAEVFLGVGGGTLALAIGVFVATLRQIELLIEQHGGGLDVGLQTNGKGNIFLVKKKKGVVGVEVARYGCLWCVIPRTHDHNWPPGSRFFLKVP